MNLTGYPILSIKEFCDTWFTNCSILPKSNGLGMNAVALHLNRSLADILEVEVNSMLPL